MSESPLSPVPRTVWRTLQSLKRNKFHATLARSTAEARDTMLQMIPAGSRVGIGDSVTLRQLGIFEELRRRGCEVINPFVPELTRDVGNGEARQRLFQETCRRTLGTDVFLASSNAVTMDGKLVNIDHAGNRVAGMIFGAPRVVLPVGRNKIVQDVDEAIHRIKNVIVPVHRRRKGKKTPCALQGTCNDCRSADRICGVTVIMEKRPAHTDLSVILIDEDLGLGWDPAWDNERISNIESEYYRHSWTFSFPRTKNRGA